MVKIKHFLYLTISALISRPVIKGAAVVVRMLLVNSDCNGGGNSDERTVMAHLTCHEGGATESE